MVKSILRPDGSAIGLFLSGSVLLFVPLMPMPGLAAIFAALAYWLTMMVFKAGQRPRN